MVNKILQSSFIWIVLIIIVCIPVVAPLLKVGYFPTHDGEWAVVRLAEMNREVKDGQFPPRWSDFLNHGYGYPLFLFTYPLPYYFGEIIHISGFSLVTSIKILFIASVFFSGIFMFFFSRKFSGNIGGFIAASLYMFAPFRLVDLYVRGSLGESVALAIFPLLFWTSAVLVSSPSLLNMILVSIVFAALILTHNIMAFVFTPFWILFLIVLVKYYYEDLRKYVIRFFLPAILLGLGLSSFFWIPVLLEKQFIVLSQIPLANLADNFVVPLEFFNSPWNYGARPSFQLGWVHFFAGFFGAFSLLFAKSIEKKKHSYVGWFIICISSLLLFLMTPFSTVIWQFLPVSFIDFPWRLMTPLTFFLAMGTMFIEERRIIRLVVLLFIFTSLFLIPNFAKPSETFVRSDLYYSTNDATTTSNDELMPVWVTQKPKDRYKEKVQLVGSGTISALTYDSRKINFTVQAQSSVNVHIQSIFYPGWKFYVDNKEYLLEKANYNNASGTIVLALSGGNHLVEGKFLRTNDRIWADVISLASISIIVICIIKIIVKRSISSRI